MGIECVERQVLGSSCPRRGRGVDQCVFGAQRSWTVDLEAISKSGYLINLVTRSSVCNESLDGESFRNTLVGCLTLVIVVPVEVAGTGEWMMI